MRRIINLPMPESEKELDITQVHNTYLSDGDI